MDEMDEFKEVFYTECYELLTDMEARLLALEGHPNILDELNAIFRCAHSIKGGAGAFAMNGIMRYTHRLETLLDALRNGSVPATRPMIDGLLQAKDIVLSMVEAEQAGTPLPETTGEAILVQLEAFAAGEDAPAAPVVAPATSATDAPASGTVNRHGLHQYSIRYEPAPETFSNGNDPLVLLQALKELGTVDVSCDTSSVPNLDEFDATRSYLGWDIVLETEADEATVREVFGFVEEGTFVGVERLDAGVDAPATAIASPEEHVIAIDEPMAVSEIVAPAPVVATAPVAPAASSAEPNSPTAESTATKPQAASSASAAVPTIRVDIDKLDRIVNTVGELVIAQSMLQAQCQGLSGEAHALLTGLEELAQHTRELQEAVMAVRMQPVKSVFARMPRVVRDLATMLGKQVELVLSGENTEVDKTVIEQLADPLTHMIRNSVDHGIESPEVRRAKGKPEQGTIHLSAGHRGGQICIQISDNGGGINRQRVLSKAIEKGLYPADVKLSDEAIDQIIFLPGFSTAETVSNVSGRGVGMDVVKKNIEAIGGNVSVKSSPDGSVFTILLPLTLAILDGMIVRVGNERYVLPVSAVTECMRPQGSQVQHLVSGNRVLNLRETFLPLLYLYEIFGIPDTQTQPENALVVVLESGRHRFGLMVDELLGLQQVVIKSMEANYSPSEGIASATILGDGKVSYILDIAQLQSQLPPMDGQTAAKVA